MPLEGIDVYNGSGNVNWSAHAKAGVVFAYIKASEGADFTDPYFERNRLGAGSAGIISGAYHYWRPDVDPVAQIQHFVTIYPRWTPGDLPPALDVEIDPGQYPSYTAAQLVAHVSTCLQSMEQLCGKRPVIYIYPAFWA